MPISPEEGVAMPGRHVNDQQVRLYMKLRPTRSQESAAAISGISVATGRRIERDPRPPSLRKEPRDYRTRSDPFEGLWDEEIVPMLESAPGLRPITVLRELARRHPDRIDDSVRRSLERRIRTWRAMHGPDQPVIFPQAHAPGRMGLSDFTDMSGLGVTIAGQALDHRLYHFALVYSGFEHGEVVLGGESYTALASGLATALTTLGGAPTEHRSDSLSAAFRNLCHDQAEDLTRRFAALAAHDGMTPTRNNRGVAHENGSIESRHGHLKDRIAQALMLRGSVDFDTLAAYRAFVAGVIADHNRRHGDAIEIERTHLKALPPAPPVTWDEASVRVTSSSGFSFRHAFYTVPSRLIGHRLHLRVHDDRIEAFLGGMPVLTLPRGRAPAKTAKRTTTHIVDYRHVIGSLRAKPGALAGLTYRDALWPRPAYRRAWEALLAVQPVRDASRTMVDLLALAHDRGIEADIAAALDAILDEGGLPVFAEIQARFIPKAASAPTVWIEMPSASAYDPLLSDRRWEMTP
jgi:hypothetical protein